MLQTAEDALRRIAERLRSHLINLIGGVLIAAFMALIYIGIPAVLIGAPLAVWKYILG